MPIECKLIHDKLHSKPHFIILTLIFQNMLTESLSSGIDTNEKQYS